MARAPLIAGALAAGLLAAGCGGPTRYSLERTRACLKEDGARTGKPLNDFVASTATAGAFRAYLGAPDDNAVTISFGESSDDAQQTADGYIRFHAKNVGIYDILELERNAVLLWKQHPSNAERSRVTGCLK